MYDMTTQYTREEFLNNFSSSDIETLGLKYPERDVMVDDYELDDDMDIDDIRDEFYYQVFIQRLEMKLWGYNDEQKNTLETILSYCEDK